MWSHPGTLEGRFVRLEPLGFHHQDNLFQRFDEETGKFLNEWRPAADQESRREVLEQFVDRPGFYSYAVVEKKTGKAIGSSCFFDLREPHKSLEIGHTWIAAPYRQTQVNPEMKLLMLSCAFDQLGCIRVQLKTDSRNERSKAAMLKLGAKPEGVLRHHIICGDGYLRDTAYFSILRDEWPMVKLNLLERLDTFDINATLPYA